ncbi:MAG: hypothetical protein KJO05_07065 [Bacteroidia bacterium]|nr:hypothetical protein [Bacteroidia bacterium]NNF30573.1 hypothetical protein [Flavobacteriaceae bacterium]MBT8277093.1 hypothetical protein [Bacteroidia bacterium]NNJ81280.1 hypothetical protein [Flavobacteriaceae bacterium]NNK53106.1 hypothetical protein [Flavobacteriaceae bacterium]
MKKIALHTLILSLLLCISAQAQIWDREFVSGLNQIDQNNKRQTKFDKYTLEEDVIGTPYNHPNYLIGNVYRGNALFATNVALRYNAVADEIEIKESLDSADEDTRVLPKDPEIFAKIENDIFVFVPFQGKIEDGGYFHVMFEGKKLDLYKKLIKKVIAGRKASSSFTQDVPTEFRDESQYFLVTKNGRFFQLPDDKNKKFDIFGANKQKVLNYAKDNGLNPGKEADLLKIIKYYDGV